MTAQLSEFYDPTTDAELANRAGLGDKAAFKQLYERYHPRVYAIAFRLCGQYTLADEITQDCFIRLWHKLPHYRGESQFSTWLHSLSVNQALNSMRTHKSFWARFLSIEAQAEAVALPDNYSELDRLILRLPERARIVFVLNAIEGYRHEEIAQLMGIAVGTSKAQYHRAKQLLQEMLP